MNVCNFFFKFICLRIDKRQSEREDALSTAEFSGNRDLTTIMQKDLSSLSVWTLINYPAVEGLLTGLQPLTHKHSSEPLTYADTSLDAIKGSRE